MLQDHVSSPVYYVVPRDHWVFESWPSLFWAALCLFSAPSIFYTVASTVTGYMLTHLCTLQSMVTLIGYLSPGRLSAGLISAFFLLTLSLVSGFPVLRWDMPAILSTYLGTISPARWVLPTLAAREYAEDALVASSAQHICRKNQVINKSGS